MLQQIILVVDDDKDILNLLEIHLKNEGYDVKKACNGEDALNIIKREKISLVILDIMMPGVDGIEVCRRIREINNLPIIFLSAKAKDIDKVIGLSTGADDYLDKPFSTIELIARVKAQLRRYHYLGINNEKTAYKIIQIKGLEIDEKSRSVSLYGRNVKLTKTEYEILTLLAKNPNRIFSLEALFERVWEEKYFEGNNTVMVHIARLRDKLKENNERSNIIQNVWGVGYKIEK